MKVAGFLVCGVALFGFDVLLPLIFAAVVVVGAGFAGLYLVSRVWHAGGRR